MVIKTVFHPEMIKDVAQGTLHFTAIGLFGIFNFIFILLCWTVLLPITLLGIFIERNRK